VLPTDGLPPRESSIGELPKDVRGPLNVPGQGDRIEGVKLGRQDLPLFGGERAGGEHPLIRGVGGVVALEDLAPDAPFAAQLADRAEEVVLQPQQTVEALQDRPGRPGAVAVVADKPRTSRPLRCSTQA